MNWKQLGLVCGITTLLAGCSSNPTTPEKLLIGPPPSNDTPRGAVTRLLFTYEHKQGAEYSGMFTGDFSYEFSSNTDPTLVQQYSTGWFKNDEKASAVHLFNGYTPPGGHLLPAATSISIKLAVDQPTDDNTSGVDPKTHKVLATRIDGSVIVPSDTGPQTYTMTDNYNVFYLVRGDVAVNLDTNQPADSLHWYVYRWVDLSEAIAPSPTREPTPAQSATWGSVKALYR